MKVLPLASRSRVYACDLREGGSEGQPSEPANVSRWFRVRLRLGGPVIAVISAVAVAACGQAFQRAGGVSTPSSSATSATSTASTTPTASINYRLAWQDDFNGPAGAPPNPALWSYVTGKSDANGELEVYTDGRSNSELDGRGDLEITARHEPDGTYTSAKIQTLGRYQVKYGRIEARIKVPAGAGLWPAFWALGSNYPQVGWPESGELDAMELSGRKPNVLVGTVHGPLTNNASGWQINAIDRAPTPLYAGFHVFGIDWSPGNVTFTLDGLRYGEVTPALLGKNEKWVFDQPYFLVLDLAVGGNFVGPPTPATPFPATMLVDWVRVWKAT
jgi:beta-glucanase (GH16 family)